MEEVAARTVRVLQKHGVERVVLLDSYLPGRKYEVRIDGHTAITGQNSTGKTSLIRLFPAFFGGEPSELVKRDSRSKLKRFSEFYLPNRGSYVVFEYRTHAGLNLAVFTTRNDTQQLRIILVEGVYDDRLFLDESNRFLDKDSFAQRARAEGRTTQSLTAIKEYRRIVFGDARARGRDHARRRFNVLEGYEGAGRFSMENVHSILVATIQSDVNIDERLLRKLLLERARRGIDLAEENLTNININTDSLQGWINNSRGLDEVRARIDDAVAALHLATRLERRGVEEAVLREAVRRRAQEIDEAIDKQQQIRSSRGEQKEALERAHEQQKLQHESRRNEHDKALREAKGERGALLNRHKREVDNGIHAALGIAAELDSRAEAANQAQRALTVLSTLSENIDQQINAEIEQGRCIWQKQLDRIDVQTADFEDKAEKRRGKLAANQEAAQSALERETQDRADKYQKALTDASEALAAAKKERELVGADPILIEKRDEALDRRDKAHEALTAAEKERDNAKHVRGEALRSKEALEWSLKDHRTKLGELSTKGERLTERLHREGTLLHYVREHLEGWEGTAGSGAPLWHRSALREGVEAGACQ